MLVDKAPGNVWGTLWYIYVTTSKQRKNYHILIREIFTQIILLVILIRCNVIVIVFLYIERNGSHIYTTWFIHIFHIYTYHIFIHIFHFNIPVWWKLREIDFAISKKVRSSHGQLCHHSLSILKGRGRHNVSSPFPTNLSWNIVDNLRF